MKLSTSILQGARQQRHQGGNCSGGLMDSTFSYIACSGGLHTEDYAYLMEEGTYQQQQRAGVKTIRTFMAVDEVRHFHDQSPVSMLPEMVAPEVFGDMLHKDTDSTLAAFNDPIVGLADELFDEKILTDVIWDKEISEELFDEKSVPEVIWDEEMSSDYAEQEEFDGTGSVATILALAEQQNCSGLKKACLHFLSSLLILGDVMATDGFEHLARSCPSTMKELIFNLPTRASELNVSILQPPRLSCLRQFSIAYEFR